MMTVSKGAMRVLAYDRRMGDLEVRRSCLRYPPLPG